MNALRYLNRHFSLMQGVLRKRRCEVDPFFGQADSRFEVDSLWYFAVRSFLFQCSPEVSFLTLRNTFFAGHRIVDLPVPSMFMLPCGECMPPLASGPRPSWTRRGPGHGGQKKGLCGRYEPGRHLPHHDEPLLRGEAVLVVIE